MTTDDFLGMELPESTKINFISIVYQTKKAILFNNGNGNFWIPKSIILDISDGFVKYENIISIKYI